MILSDTFDTVSLENDFLKLILTIYSACAQSVLIYGTETWAMKADDLRSLERTERMMVRWMCGVSLKYRECSEDLCNLLGINCVADVVRRGRLIWFEHLECRV